MAHANARLTEFGRLLLVQRITELGWRPQLPTARCPHALTPAQVRRILAARRRHRQGPHRLAFRLGMARSTIYGVLRRHGMSRLASMDRASGVVVRYQRTHPGELIHIDVKKWGGSQTVAAPRPRPPCQHPTGRGIGYDYVHSAVDDRSRVAFSQILPDETAMTAAYS